MSKFTAVQLLNPISINLGSGPNFTGEYNALTAYNTGDSVSYLGSSYIALAATTGNLPTSTAHWQLLAEKGDDGAVGATGADGADGAGVPIGGTTGQILAKNSNTDYDTEWVDQSGGVTDHTLLSNIGTNSHAQIDSHIASTSNPHSVTKTQVGLGNVDNTSDVTKNSAPVSLTNKTIDADLNTITNIEDADIKAGAAIDATKIADGSVSSTEFQYINSLTSNAQTQIDGKQATITGAATTITTSNLTPDRVLISTGAPGKVAVSTCASTQLNYLDATSSIQTQLNSLSSSVSNKVDRSGDSMTGSLLAPNFTTTSSDDGYVWLVRMSSAAPVTPNDQGVQLYAYSDSILGIRQATPEGNRSALLNVTNLTADRVYFLPDIDGTIMTDNLSDGRIWVGNASNEAAEVPISGDISMDNTGLTSINTGVIVNSDISDTAAISLTKTRHVVTALTDAANISLDSSTGTQWTVTLGGNRTLSNPTSAYNGQVFLVAVKQDGTGNRTLSYDTKFVVGDVDTTLSTAANTVDYLLFRYDSVRDKFDILDLKQNYV